MEEYGIIIFMQKNTVTKILIVILSCLVVIGGMVADALWLAPDRLNIRQETIADEKIPESLNDLRICYFTDLDYGLFVDEQRVIKITEQINAAGADIVIFGGDLYEDTITPDETGNAILTSALASIQAPYGKFAVYGDHDNDTPEHQAMIDAIYHAAGFEVINDASLSLHKGTSASITLVGLNHGMNEPADIQSAYANVSANNLVLTVCHTPDSADLVPADLTDYMLAGHSHGGQANLGFIALDTPALAVSYLAGKHQIRESFFLDISSGVGTTIKNVRFMTGNEIVIYRFVHHTTQNDESKTTE